VASYSKLKNVDGIKLFYIWGVSFCNPIAPLAKSDDVLIICQGIEQESYNNNENLIRFMNTTDEYAKKLFSYFRQKGWKKIGIVLTDHLYPEGMFIALGAAVGGIVSEHISPRIGLGLLPFMIFIGFIILTIGKRRLFAANNIPTEEEDLAAIEDLSDPNK
jgi:hypothetical protein